MNGALVGFMTNLTIILSMSQIKCLQDQLAAKTKQAKESQQEVSWVLL